MKTALDRIKELVEELRGPDGRPANRETALAITKLEEAALWLREGQKEGQ